MPRIPHPPATPPAETVDQEFGPSDAPVASALRALMRRAEKARYDLASFYEFVIRHETTKQPLKVAPHQRLQFRFVTDFRQCVVRQPVGTAKTFGMTALTLFEMGRDPTQRGAILSKTQGQSAKVLRMVSDYITEPELTRPLNLVFPHLAKSQRAGDTWTQTAITVQRPAGIRDPSAVAVGIDGSINGSRLSWLFTDDLLDSDNTATQQMREQLHSRFDSRALSRLDPSGARVVVTNTPWNREDLTYQLEALGWPTITMDIYGFVEFTNVPEAWILATGLVRRSSKREGAWRLLEHGDDPDEVIPLWPERYSLQTIADIRAMRLPHEFARLYLCRPFDEATQRCQRTWIEAAKLRGRGQWDGLGPVLTTGGATYTGVDLAFGTGKRNDYTGLVTFEVFEDGTRRLIDVERTKKDGVGVVDMLIAKHDYMGSVVTVENNNAQDLVRQFALERRSDLRVRPHSTQGRNKHDVDFGVESVFAEFKQGAWIIPCDVTGRIPPEWEALFDQMLYYQPPPAHTGDLLMALWMARESVRKGRAGRDPKPRAGLRLTVPMHGGGF